jgi:NitT/TauT family transport system substrate-binding protein
MKDSADRWNRRAFLRGAALAGTAGLVGLRPEWARAEPSPETTRLRLARFNATCVAPQYVAEELLRGEGFIDVEYPMHDAKSFERAIATGAVDMSIWFGISAIREFDAGDPIVFLSPVHVGCYEVFGSDRVRRMADLKGKNVAIDEFGGTSHALLASMVAYIGLNSQKDVNWVIHPPAEMARLLRESKIDAFVTLPPFSNALRAQGARVIMSSVLDRPWSQYFCCFVIGNREFVRKNPMATKRALRAILKGADMCALQPDRVAQRLVAKGYAESSDFVSESLKEIPYGRWRGWNPNDTLRFLAVRLHEAGLIKASPQQIIAQGTDWRFLDELKKELKG